MKSFETPIKVLLITNIPNPYRIPLFNELNKQLLKRGIDFKVIFGAKGYPWRKWNIDMSECEFDYEVLSSRKITLCDPEKPLFSYRGLLRLINKEKPNVVITPGFSLASIKLWARSWFSLTNYIIWSGSIWKKGRFDSFLRRLQRKIIIKKAVRFVAYGTKSREYLISLSAPHNNIVIGINTIDTQFYLEKVKSLRNNPVPLNKKKHLLYIGYLSPRKNILKVLEIIKALSQIRTDFLLDVVGDGEERVKLQKYVDDNKLQNYVQFHGYKQKQDIPQFMANADCFFFQTDFDIWGLVLNEAMASGLPCIASIHAGSTYDLVLDGITGFAMDFSDTEKVLEKVQWILENPKLAREIGLRASRFIENNVNLKKSAEGFVKAIEGALDPKFLNLRA